MDKLAVSHPLLTLSGGIVIVLLLRRLATKKPKYLPGPTGVPLLGNLFQIPETNSWEVYTRWKDIYGQCSIVVSEGRTQLIHTSSRRRNVSHSNGKPHCRPQLISSMCRPPREAVRHLLRPAVEHDDQPTVRIPLLRIPASRTFRLITGDPYSMGWWQAVTMAPYGDRWRRFRRITAQAMRKGAVEQYWPSQEREVKRFLGSLIAAPEKYLANFRLCVGYPRGVSSSYRSLSQCRGPSVDEKRVWARLTDC